MQTQPQPQDEAHSGQQPPQEQPFQIAAQFFSAHNHTPHTSTPLCGILLLHHSSASASDQGPPPTPLKSPWSTKATSTHTQHPAPAVSSRGLITKLQSTAAPGRWRSRPTPAGSTPRCRPTRPIPRGWCTTSCSISETGWSWFSSEKSSQATR